MAEQAINEPTNIPTNVPTDTVVNEPTNVPTDTVVNEPTNVPTNVPTNESTNIPTNVPTNVPNIPTSDGSEEEIPVEAKGNGIIVSIIGWVILIIIATSMFITIFMLNIVGWFLWIGITIIQTFFIMLTFAIPFLVIINFLN